MKIDKNFARGAQKMNSTSLKGAGTHVNLRAAPNPHVGGHYAPAKRHIRRLWITPCGALLIFFTFSQKSEGDWGRSKLQAHEMCMKVTIQNVGSQRPNLAKGRAGAHTYSTFRAEKCILSSTTQNRKKFRQRRKITKNRKNSKKSLNLRIYVCTGVTPSRLRV